MSSKPFLKFIMKIDILLSTENSFTKWTTIYITDFINLYWFLCYIHNNKLIHTHTAWQIVIISMSFKVVVLQFLNCRFQIHNFHLRKNNQLGNECSNVDVCSVFFFSLKYFEYWLIYKSSIYQNDVGMCKYFILCKRTLTIMQICFIVSSSLVRSRFVL